MTPPTTKTIIDSTPCVVRHVRRRADDTEASTDVMLARLHAAAGAELEALNGEAGWQSGTVSVALSDDGSATLVMPNAVGDDGKRHRERFAILTDPLYRIGEEWIEVYRGEQMRPEDLEIVFTPGGVRADRTRIELRGPDLMALYTLARSSELDVWHHAPRDVFEYYTRLPISILADDFTDWAATGSGSTPPPSIAHRTPAYTARNYVKAAPSTGAPGVLLDGAGGAGSASMTWDLTADVVEPDAFDVTAQATLLVTGGAAVSLLATDVGAQAIFLQYNPSTGEVSLLGGQMAAASSWHAKGKVRREGPGPCAMRLLVRRCWVYGFIDGELAVYGRRLPAYETAGIAQIEFRTPGPIVASAAILTRLDVTTLAPFGLRGADKGDLRLPGTPTPGGLRGRYWNEAPLASQAGGATTAYREAALDDLRDPSDSRLDGTINFSAAAAWAPPAVQNPSGYFSARWTGAVYLDLSGNGRRLRLTALEGAARVWIGRTLLDADAAINSWTLTGVTKNDLRTGNLRDTLAQGSGWYPIVVEYVTDGATAHGAIKLEESALDGAGAPTGGWTAVPASKLSPLGCYEGLHRLESHRELLGSIASGFGYQWRVDPRKLETGEFPGQVIPRIRVGTDTDKVLADDEAIDVALDVDAVDAVDRLLVDAAGIADPRGANQLTADLVNDAAIADGHLFLSTGAESLPEITEVDLLTRRASSFLALRSGPNEQVSARPQGDVQELTDTFPITGVLARRRWRPGDGLRLALEDLSVIDATPRQLLAVTRPIYRVGVGAPQVGWRQRPRGLRAFLSRTARALYAGARNYQGESVIVTGNYASNAGDNYSRVPLPEDLRDAIDLDLVVEAITGAGTIEVNGVSTTLPVSVTGRHPLKAYIARDGTAPRVRVRITGAATYEMHVELRVRL